RFHLPLASTSFESVFFFLRYLLRRPLHSFPTRRSSDLSDSSVSPLVVFTSTSPAVGQRSSTSPLVVATVTLPATEPFRSTSPLTVVRLADAKPSWAAASTSPLVVFTVRAP